MEESDVIDDLRLLRDTRDGARDELADLPAPMPVPRIDQVDVDGFRRDLLAGWEAATLEDKRRALGQLIDHVDLKPGEAVVHYRWAGEASKNQGNTPYGPPEGSAPINRGWVLCGEVSPPKVRVGTAL